MTRNKSKKMEIEVQEKALQTFMPLNHDNNKRAHFIDTQQKDGSFNKCFELAYAVSTPTKEAKWKFTFKRKRSDKSGCDTKMVQR